VLEAGNTFAQTFITCRAVTWTTVTLCITDILSGAYSPCCVAFRRLDDSPNSFISRCIRLWHISDVRI